MTAHPLGFLDQLERDWEATRTCAPDRDQRLDDMHDDALVHHCVRAGMTVADALRAVTMARRAMEAHRRP
ncbi:hypothetical protein [Streptomyces sp. SID11385]|uniref:hypothetical protein n=1 Tax=Streptomyces sp. SID11385 TaxID=2706031 RepID=UPI0013C7400B|nr:hypothetical protein [Streptomyces sp. SID11385]NEA42740.1 hypothetical protein [Streptomyces sp. SID11385]